MAPSTHLLSVSLGYNPITKRWDFEEIGFDHFESYCFGESNEGFPVNAEEGLRAICLLALQVKRARMRGLTSEVPPGLRAMIDPYWNSKAKAGWPSILFGENPWKKYIHGFIKNGRLHLDLDDTVNVDVLFQGLKTGQHPPVIDQILELFSHPSQENEEEDALIINVHKAAQIISNIEQRGSLRPNDQIKVEITAPIEDEICVFWIDSGNNGFFPLYPVIDSRLKLSPEEACGFSSDDGFKTYRIPSNQTIGISGTGGIETCLVLRRPQSFTKADRSAIQGIIEQNLESRDPTFFFENPKYIFGTREDFRNMEPRISETRLEPGWQIEQWEGQLAEQLAPYYEWLHLFHIPNRGSKVT